MTKLLYVFILMSLFTSSGCRFSPLSPDSNIDNKNGRIGELKNNQNGLMSEIEALKSELAITKSQLRDVMNAQNNISSNQNSGVQILQGDGPLIVIFASIVIMLILYYFYRTSELNKKAAQILAEEIKRRNDEDLNEDIAKAILHTDIEKHVAKMLNWTNQSTS